MSDVCSNYIDDVIVYSDSWSEHLADLTRVIKRLGEVRLTIKRSKCEFGKRYMLYLGHHVGGGMLAVPEMRVSSMAKYGRPITKKQLRSFLGSVGYYRDFVKNFASLSSALTLAISLSAPRMVRWTAEMDTAFKLLRESLCNRVVLHVPCVCDVFVLYTDASGGGLGGCLHVIRDERERPVAFFSRQLRGAEHSYTVTELETLAIVATILHFDFYLYGTSLIVYTDHRPCTALLSSKHLNRRHRHFMLKLQDRDIDIRYRPARVNGNADGLSRQDWDEDLSEAVLGDKISSSSTAGEILGGGDVGSALRHGEDRKEVKRGQGEEQDKKRGQEKDQEKKRQ